MESEGLAIILVETKTQGSMAVLSIPGMEVLRETRNRMARRRSLQTLKRLNTLRERHQQPVFGHDRLQREQEGLHLQVHWHQLRGFKNDLECNWKRGYDRSAAVPKTSRSALNR